MSIKKQVAVQSVADFRLWWSSARRKERAIVPITDDRHYSALRSCIAELGETRTEERGRFLLVTRLRSPMCAKHRPTSSALAFAWSTHTARTSNPQHHRRHAASEQLARVSARA